MRFTSKIGRTVYTLEETGTPTVLRVTRKSGDKEESFLFPRELVVDYLCNKVTPKTADFVNEDLGRGPS